jgi:hypothetical protein
MIQSKEKGIDGATYVVTQFPARRALALQTRLLKLLGPSLATALGGVHEGRIDAAVLSISLQQLGEKLDESATVDLVMQLLSGTRKDGKEITEGVFDLEFAGRMDTLYKVLGFVLEVNFGGFFEKSGIGDLLGRRAPATEEEPVPPSA